MLQLARSTGLGALLALLTAAAPALADEYSVETFTGGYQAPAGTATEVLGANQDDAALGVKLPFDFPYFGRTYGTVTISTNGWMAFGSTTLTASVNPALPTSAAPNGVLAPLWDDLKTADGGVRTFVEGLAPARVFVIDWHGLESFDRAASGLAFQVRLSEGSGVIEFTYAAGGDYDGLSYTAAIEDPSGAIAFGAVGTGSSLDGRPGADARFTPRSVVVSGRVVRDRPVADSTGLGNSTETGIAVEAALVRLVRDDTGEIAGTAATAADGSFSIETLGVDFPTRLSVDLLTSGSGGTVRGGDGSVYAHRIAAAIDADETTTLADVTLGADVDTVNAPFRRALNIHQALERGYRVAQAAADIAAQSLPVSLTETIPPLATTWIVGSAPAGGTAYTPAPVAGGVGGTGGATLVVSDAPANPDAYDDDVLLREYGLHVLSVISVSPDALPAARGAVTSTTPALAWVEGFGTWFACALQDRATFVDTVSSSLAVAVDVESPPAIAVGTTYPVAVTGSLWDLVDEANETIDEFAGSTGPAPSTFQDVFTAVDRRMDALAAGSDAFTILDFFAVFRDGGAPDDDVARTQMARAFIGNGTLADDLAEPDDRPDEATPGATPGTRFVGRQLSPDNSDVFRIDLAGPNPQVLEVALVQTTDVDLTLFFVGVAGSVIDSETNVGVNGASRQVLRMRLPAPVPPGTYYARVQSNDEETGQYALSVFNPLELGGADELAWTAGVPFKQDFSAAGGIPPYTYQTSTGGAPGLAVAEAGARITGVPSGPGAFTLDVALTDGAAPTNTETRTVPLTINPALSLPVLFAVPAERQIDRSVGTGGTSPSWTPDDAPPGALALVGGSDLRLVGASGPPAAFEISAHADDAVGATLPTTPVQVVVTRDIFAADASAVPTTGRFGYFVDALEGSQIKITLRFRGESGRRPDVVAFIDDFGVPFLPESTVKTSGRKLTFEGPLTRETGRYHLVLESVDFVGTVRVDAEVTPPKRVLGEAAVEADGPLIEVPVDVLAGARVRIVLRRSPSPTSLEPTVVAVVAPDGNLLSLPTQRRRRRGSEVRLAFDAEAAGRYLLRFDGNDGTTGPLFYNVRVKTPRKARLVLD